MNQFSGTIAPAAEPALLRDVVALCRRPASPWQNPAEHQLPATFEERGVAVPFTTPALIRARARFNAKGRLELAIGRDASRTSEFVVAWHVIPELFALTVHDVALLHAVQVLTPCDPLRMWHAGLQVAASGLAGPEMANSAKSALARDADARAANQAVLFFAVIRQIENASAEPLFQAIRLPSGQARIREILLGSGNRLKRDAMEVERTLAALGDRTYAVGAPGSPEKGRLRRLLTQLSAFRKSTSSWAEERLGEASDQARFCAAIAAHTADIATKSLARFDAAMKNPIELLSQSSGKMAEIDRMVARLSWLLDGWDSIIESWFSAKTDFERTEFLGEIIDALPIVPKLELNDADAAGSLTELTRLSRCWIRAREGRGSGEIDMTMVHRIEQMRAKTFD